MGRIFQKEKESAISFGVGREYGVSKQAWEDSNGANIGLSAEHRGGWGQEAHQVRTAHTAQGLGYPGMDVDFTQSSTKPW